MLTMRATRQQWCPVDGGDKGDNDNNRRMARCNGQQWGNVYRVIGDDNDSNQWHAMDNTREMAAMATDHDGHDGAMYTV